MTTKRFMVDDAGTLIDMQTGDMFDIVEEVCPLLNEQHEIIGRLKENIDELLSVDVEEELLKENEQLKKELYRVYDDDYYLKQFIMAIVTVFSSGNNGLSKGRYELIVDACEMNKTSLKEFFK